MFFCFSPDFQEREKNDDTSEDGHQNDDPEKDEQAHLLSHSLQQKPQEEEKSDQAAAAWSSLGVSPPSSTIPSGSLPLPTLSEISLEVKPGELVCVYGPTGCGKSSLLLSLLGEVRRVEGTVEVRNDNVIFKRCFVGFAGGLGGAVKTVGYCLCCACGE